MVFNGLSHEAAVFAVNCLTFAYTISGDSDKLAEEDKRLREIFQKGFPRRESQIADADAGFLRRFADYYLELDEAGRMAEQDRMKAISNGEDKYAVMEKSVTALNANYCDLTAGTNNQLAGIELVLADELPELRKSIDKLTATIAGMPV